MIKVIVAITTYNLEKYIAAALDSVIMQKTNFDYKIVIADDASTDATISILKGYKEKFPDLIELKLAEKNMGSLANSNRLFDKIQCEYFTFLDGDDIWLDEYHLQKQVDFLDSNPSYSMCAGNTQYLVDGKPKEMLLEKKYLGKSYSFSDLLKDKIPFFHTSSILLRNTIFINGLPKCYYETIDTFENCALRGEDFRRILHLEKGPVFIMKDLFSYYRIHNKGIWQGSSNDRKVIEGAIGMNFYSKYFAGKYNNYFENKSKETYNSLIKYMLYERKLINYYELSEKDSYLFTAYLNDIRKDVNPRKSNKLKKFISRILLKFYTYFSK